jgi:tripartite-type tricarboxylate transporter receptor subunit TctC
MLPTRPLSRRLVGLLAIAGAVACLATNAAAQAKLDSPLHLVVGYAPGGATDRVARIVGDKLQAPSWAWPWWSTTSPARAAGWPRSR